MNFKIQEVEVGTMRSNIPLQTVLRVAERYLLPKQKEEEEDDITILWCQARAFNDMAYGDFVLDDKTPYIIATNFSKRSLNFEDDGTDIMAPSILAREHGHILRKETITTSDFMLPTNLLSSSNDKIYGFYYVT